MKIWKLDEIRYLLETNDKAVINGLIAIYNKQTADEKVVNETKHSNGVGFTGADAKVLSNMAKYAIAKGGLTEKQFIYVKKEIGKYAGQLTKIANKQI